MRWCIPSGMRILIILIATLLLSDDSTAQRVLHFTRTSGFDHQTRSVSNSMFQSIGNELGVVVDDDATGDPFSDASTLEQYAVIVFSNTSGNAILSAQQRANFEAWIASGGHVLGIHAASDTYRHSTANGNNTGTWDFYPEMLGASVQENPNHVNGTPTYTMQRFGAHPSIYNIPDQWEKAEEYYYWEGGYFAEFNTEVLVVEETVGPNGLVNSYDAPRPMSWYRFLPQSNSKVFYTALGHAQDNFTSDALFRAHIKDALGWLLEGTTGLNSPAPSDIGVAHAIMNDILQVTTTPAHSGSTLRLFDAIGRTVHEQRISSDVTTIDLRTMRTGIHVLAVGDQFRSRIVIAR